MIDELSAAADSYSFSGAAMAEDRMAEDRTSI
jgi:hypothetical protein